MPAERTPRLTALRTSLGATLFGDAAAVFAWMRWDDADTHARLPDPATVATRLVQVLPALADAVHTPGPTGPDAVIAPEGATVEARRSDARRAPAEARACLAALCALTARIAWWLQQCPEGGHGVAQPAGDPDPDREPDLDHDPDREPDRAGDAMAARSAYGFPDVAERAMGLAFELVRDACRADAAALVRRMPLVQTLRAAAAASALDNAAVMVTRRAALRGIPVVRLSSRIRLLQLGQGVLAHRVFESGTDLDAHTGARLASNKMATAETLHRIGLPGTVHQPARDVDHARRIARGYGYPVVVKPSHGEKQMGVSIGVRDDDDMARAFDEARAIGKGLVLVERLVPGYECRLFVVGGRLVSAARRHPAAVVGDGRSSIDALIDALNADPRRGVGPDYELVPVRHDADLDDMLHRQGLTRTSVPAPGRHVVLRRHATPPHGGTTEECIDRVHPDVRAMAQTIARALKVQVLGIDYLSTDIARSWREVGGAVCDVNLTPGLRPHGHLGVDAMLELLFPDGGDGRIPTIALVGANAVTRSRHVETLLTACGRTVGRVEPGRVSVAGAPLTPPAGAPPPAPTAVYEHPDVDCAVFALDDETLRTGGLPFDRCDVLVLERGDAGARALLLPRTRGVVLVDDTCPDSAAVVAQVGAARVVRMRATDTLADLVPDADIDIDADADDAGVDDRAFDAAAAGDRLLAAAICLRIGVPARAVAQAMRAARLTHAGRGPA